MNSVFRLVSEESTTNYLKFAVFHCHVNDFLASTNQLC